jgi:hypothetical protein
MYWPKAKPCSMKFHDPAVTWREGRLTASGIQVVPDPIRSMEIPSGTATVALAVALAVSADGWRCWAQSGAAAGPAARSTPIRSGMERGSM